MLKHFSHFSRAILQNRDVLAHTPWSNLLSNDFWGTPLSHNGSHKSFRPLCTATFKLNHLLAGFQPFSFHLFNVLLHALATCLFVVLADVILPTQASVVISGILFATHPVHVEAVAGLVGRADLLAAIFFILSILSFKKHSAIRDGKAESVPIQGKTEEDLTTKVHQYDDNGNLLCLKKQQQEMFIKQNRVKHNSCVKEFSNECKNENFNLGLSIFFAACAMFSKEQGITALGVCIVMDAAKSLKHKEKFSLKSPKLRSLVSLVLAAAFLLLIRARAMGYSSPAFAKADNPASASDSLLTRTLTFLYLPVFNFRLLLCPSRLSFDWSMRSIELVTSFQDFRNVETLLFYSTLTTICFTTLKNILRKSKKKAARNNRVKCESEMLVTCLSIIVLSFLPASNFLFYVGFVVAERVLYIPSIGFCLVSGWAIARVLEALHRRRHILLHKTSTALTVVLLMSLGLRTIRRNHDWKNEENLYSSGVEINPPKGKKDIIFGLRPTAKNATYCF